MSVERNFSTTGEILTNYRNRLKPKTAEILLFLRKNMLKIQFRYDLKNKEQPLDSQDDTDPERNMKTSLHLAAANGHFQLFYN